MGRAAGLTAVTMELNERKIATLTNWLIAGAPPRADFCETIAELGRRLNDLGMGADSVTIFRIPINPLVRGRMTVWTVRSGARLMDHDHDVMNTGYYIGSVAQACYESGRAVRYRVGKQPEFDENPGSQISFATTMSTTCSCPLSRPTRRSR